MNIGIEKRLSALEQKWAYGWSDILQQCTTLYDLGMYREPGEMVAFISQVQEDNKTFVPIGTEATENLWNEHLGNH